ncbi:release factor glutamine methyltransferase [Raphidocelis subcapitata]|uniref:Release factor glutamine methyltransferase n=1 Tax=Raphidocelis subcapitata TaxID=307507 RepID=A0A2V0NRT2_9CHLO|nr:release factor glutamine methyltransferase [Raphidocelis subcapitata]|eukprot:GBF88263.1 release factor glutamine methyltransferase [Raphidocelis subcapitata]
MMRMRLPCLGRGSSVGGVSAAAAAAAVLRLRPGPSHTLAAWRLHSWVPAAADSRLAEITSAEDVPVPLCRRPPVHEEALAALMDWRAAVLQRIEAVGDAFESADGGPGRALLQREVTWALDDAVSAYRDARDGPWRPCNWQQLEAEVRTAQARRRQSGGGTAGAAPAPEDGWQVQLRAPVAELRALWQRRLEERVPFQYLLHAAHWREFVLSVGPGVLVPRPETEGMIEMAAAALDAAPALADAPWADLGTGSGALAVGLATLLARRRRGRWTQRQAGAAAPAGSSEQTEPAVWAVDLSPVAAAYAAANAAACAPPGAVRVVRGSWWAPLAHLRGRLGGVLTNPPYIPRAEMGALQQEVGAHEPHGALDGGPGPGLDSLEVICDGAGDMLVDGGYIAIETAGGEQAHRVRQLLDASGVFERAAVVDDCFGVGRFVEAFRRPR